MEEMLRSFVSRVRSTFSDEFPELDKTIEAEFAFSWFEHVLTSTVSTLPRDRRYKKTYCTGCQQDVYKAT
jgi:hypothetical protein